MQRRSFLKLGAGTAALLAVAGAGVAMWQPGWQQGRLGPAARQVLTAVADAVLDGALPATPAERAQALQALVTRFETTVSGLPAVVRGEISDLFAVLGTAPGRRVIAGLSTPWAQAPIGEVAMALQDMRRSSLAVRQQAYHALRDLVNAAWYADASTWAQMGYPGPRTI